MENKREDNVDEQRFVLIFTYRNLFKTRLFVFHALFFFFLYLLFDSLKRQFDFLKLLVVLHGYKSGIINFFLVSFTFSFQFLQNNNTKSCIYLFLNLRISIEIASHCICKIIKYIAIFLMKLWEHKHNLDFPFR